MRAAPVIQAVGVGLCTLVFASAELAALLLEKWPTSQTLWYLNLEVFSFFRYGQHPASPLRFAFSPDSWWIAFVVLGAVILAFTAHLRLLLAALSNVVLTLTGALAYSVLIGSRSTLSASLQPFASSFREWDGVAVAVLLMLALSAFVVSHWSYLVEVRAGLARRELIIT